MGLGLGLGLQLGLGLRLGFTVRVRVRVRVSLLSISIVFECFIPYFLLPLGPSHLSDPCLVLCLSCLVYVLSYLALSCLVLGVRVRLLLGLRVKISG